MKIQVSKYFNTHRVNDHEFLIWNRYCPSILKINREGKNLFDQIAADKIIVDKTNPFVEMLLKSRVLYEDNGDGDRAKTDFVSAVKESVNNAIGNIESNRLKYNNMAFDNDICNLRCSYCVKNHKFTPKVKNVTGAERCRAIDIFIDQFFEKKKRDQKEKIAIPFNGGEILINWNSIQYIVERISQRYSGYDISYTLNTNMTLMTKEIAEFLNKHNFIVHVSIDGYETLHNKTRISKDGQKTFSKIIDNINMYRKYNPNKPLGFQGTIEFVDDFCPEKVYQMNKYGFQEARLAPNLLNTTVEDAKKKARLMGEFIELNKENTFQVSEAYFENLTDLINLDEYHFYFNCRGLSCFPTMEISLNLTSLSVSQMCTFIPNAFVSYEELDYDIYNNKLIEITKRIISERFETYLTKCIDCDSVAICRGGCIYTGIDKDNSINESACAYQRELWQVYLEKVHLVEARAA